MDPQLIYAIECLPSKYLKKILDTNVDVNELGSASWNTMLTTAIIMATNTKSLSKVKLLLETERVTNINTSDGFGRSPLYIASKNGYYEIAKLLLKYGADANLPPIVYPEWFGIKTKTPLDVAKNNKMRELLQKII